MVKALHLHETQETENKIFPAEMVKKGGDAGGLSGEKYLEPAMNSDHEKAAVDLFYEKLCKLNESSGLSLLFNFRETMLDLHRFYNEVMKRGGFYQVTKQGKWDDVASASNLKSCSPMSAAQLQNVYEMLVLQYELMYSRKIPDQANIWPDKNSQGFLFTRVNPSCATGKRKHWDSSSPGEGNIPVVKLEHSYDRCQSAAAPVTAKKISSMITSKNSNDNEKDTDAPLKPRTGYQIFLRLETDRLKKVLGKSSNTQNLRDMAIHAWRSLPEKDKLPYIAASKIDRERYEKEMAAYKQRQDNQNAKSQTLFSSTGSVADDVYHVSFEEDSGNFHSPDESMVELAIEAMKKAKSNDSIFRIDLDNGSVD